MGIISIDTNYSKCGYNDIYSSFYNFFLQKCYIASIFAIGKHLYL